MTPMIEQLHTTIDTLKGEVKVLKGALKKSADAHGDALTEVENMQRERDKAQAHCEQLRTELETARRQYADDWAEDDTALKAICKKHGIAEDYGRDIDGFKSWVDCVEELSTKCEALQADVTRWQGVAERSLAHNDPLVAKLAASQAREARLRSILRQIVNDLPTNRDWLSPDLEREALAETGEDVAVEEPEPYFEVWAMVCYTPFEEVLQEGFEWGIGRVFGESFLAVEACQNDLLEYLKETPVNVPDGAVTVRYKVSGLTPNHGDTEVPPHWEMDVEVAGFEFQDIDDSGPRFRFEPIAADTSAKRADAEKALAELEAAHPKKSDRYNQEMEEYRRGTRAMPPYEDGDPHVACDHCEGKGHDGIEPGVDGRGGEQWECPKCAGTGVVVVSRQETGPGFYPEPCACQTSQPADRTK